MANRFRRIKRIEYSLETIGRNAGTGVLDFNVYRLRIATRAHSQPMVRTLHASHCLLGVGDEIQNHLLQLISIHHRARRGSAYKRSIWMPRTLRS